MVLAFIGNNTSFAAPMVKHCTRTDTDTRSWHQAEWHPVKAHTEGEQLYPDLINYEDGDKRHVLMPDT